MLHHNVSTGVIILANYLSYPNRVNASSTSFKNPSPNLSPARREALKPLFFVDISRYLSPSPRRRGVGERSSNSRHITFALFYHLSPVFLEKIPFLQIPLFAKHNRKVTSDFILASILICKIIFKYVTIPLILCQKLPNK